MYTLPVNVPRRRHHAYTHSERLSLTYYSFIDPKLAELAMLADIQRTVYPEEVTRALHVLAQYSSPVIDRRSNRCACEVVGLSLLANCVGGVQIKGNLRDRSGVHRRSPRYQEAETILVRCGCQLSYILPRRLRTLFGVNN